MYAGQVSGVLGFPACVALSSLLLMCASEPAAPTTVRLAVPTRVADEAAARAHGDASAPSPVLILEDLEVGAGEALKIKVLAPSAPGPSGPGEILGVAAMVGTPRPVPAAPLRRVNLAVPLNELASRLLAGKTAVTLVLAVEGGSGRPPLTFKRAYFDTGQPQ